MPEKICECGQKSHVRVKICPACKREFIKGEKIIKEKDKKKDDKKESVDKEEQKDLKVKVRKKLTDDDITIGKWRNDTPKGLPKIEIPEPLPANKRLSIREVRDIVSDEGLGYAIMEYIDPKKIMDDVLRDMWTIAKKQLIEIKMYVYKE